MTKVSPAYVGIGILISVGLIVTTAACHRAGRASTDADSSARPSEITTGQTALSSPPSATRREPLQRQKASGRVVAIGDLHGDLAAARQAFRIAKVIDNADHWIGGNSVVVQIGDVLDRGNEERLLLEWLERLAALAQQGGGVLHRVNGNHEVMNVAGDLRYVTDAGFTAFAEYARGPLPGPLNDVPEAQRGRLMAFLPGGPWARRLAQYPVVLLVNDTVFAHGGLAPKHLEYGLDRMNAEIAAWMRGTKPLPRALASDDAPFWDRTYGDSASESDCQTLEVILAELAAKRLVIGHTPQKDGITFACNNRVARIDVGLSNYYGHHPAAVLEITEATMRVLTEKSLTEKLQAQSGHSSKRKASSQPANLSEARP